MDEISRSYGHCNGNVNIRALKSVLYCFLMRADPFSGICLDCISVRNKIYVLEIEMLGPVVLAR